MSKPAGLERAYRRLVAWYPRSFRREQEEELLGVLMAGSRPGQRRPGLAETADLLRGAVAMRLLHALRTEMPGQRRRDALALFSVLAPAFLVLMAMAEVAVPYRIPGRYLYPPPFAHEIGGLSLLHVPVFDIAAGFQVIVAAAALLGRRRLTLAAMTASALFWVVARYGPASLIPDGMQLLAAGAYILSFAAVLASPGPARGRQLLSWRHWAVLLPAAALVQVTTLMLDTSSGYNLLLLNSQPSPDISGYALPAVLLGAATAVLAVALRLNRYLLLLLLVMAYPYAAELACSGIFSGDGWQWGHDLLRFSSPANPSVLLGPPLLAACAVLLIALRARRSRVVSAPRRAA